MNNRQCLKRIMKDFDFLDEGILANYRVYYRKKSKPRLRLIRKMRQRQYDQFFYRGASK